MCVGAFLPPNEAETDACNGADALGSSRIRAPAIRAIIRHLTASVSECQPLLRFFDEPIQIWVIRGKAAGGFPGLERFLVFARSGGQNAEEDVGAGVSGFELNRGS